MKRFFVLLFLLAFFPVVSFSVSESDFIGTWAQTWKTDMSTWRIRNIQINNNHVAYLSTQFFTDNGPGETDSKVCTWASDGKKIVFSISGEEYLTLYLLKEHRLSPNLAGTSQFYVRVPTYEFDYDSVANAQESSEIDLNPIGRWTSFFYQPDLKMDDIFYSYDYYFFPDGSVNALSVTKHSNDSELSASGNSGIWIGDRNDITLRVGKNTSKAFIDDFGIMYMNTSTDFMLILYRVPSDRQVYEMR